MRKLYFLIAFILIAHCDLHAQWVKVGPEEGFYGLQTDPQGLYLFGHVAAGIIRSSDLGLNWTSLSIGPSDLVFYPSGEILAGTAGGEFFRSTDYGARWDSISNSMSGTRLTALCRADGKLIAGTMSSGFFLSTDSARTWVPIDSGFAMPDGITILSISALLVSDGFIIAGTTYPFGGGLGIYRARLGSYIWHNTGLPEINIMALDTIGSIVFSGTYDLESANGAGIYRSDDSGNSWQPAVFQPPYYGVKSLTYSAPYLIAGHDFSGVSFSNFSGVSFSSDSGRSWEYSEGLPTNPDTEWIDVDGVAVERGFVFAGIEGTMVGLWRRPLSDFDKSGVASNNPSTSSSISVFPNPATEQLRIMPGPSGTLRLFDLLGRNRAETQDDGTGASLDVSKLEAGTYFLRIGNQSATVEIAR